MAKVAADPRFEERGRFGERRGPLGRGTPFSQTKLCVVATDLAFLRELLYGISLRADCYYVKYGSVPREGMYLGRCFFATDEAAAELCAELKGHPRLMVSLQNDAEFAKFRVDRAARDAFGTWDYLPEDESEVHALIESAFGRSDEAKLVHGEHAAGSAVISLVAGMAPENRRDKWPLVGHVLFRPVSIDGHAERRGLGLGPLAVLPAYRRRGIGASLVKAGLRRARLLGYDHVVMLGLSQYSARLGFVPASNFGLTPASPTASSSLTAIELVPGALANASGSVRYGPAVES
jgi:putative acetyltransferase